ncbi:MAG: leucyl aminopeptidase family protein [Saprospiraceae bacterium]
MIKSIPTIDLSEVQDFDVILVPVPEKEKKKFIKFLTTIGEEAWVQQAIQLIENESLNHKKTIEQWVGASRLVLIPINEKDNISKLSNTVRLASFKCKEKAKNMNTVLIIPELLASKTITAICNGVSLAEMRVDYYKVKREDVTGKLNFFIPDKQTRIQKAVLEGITLAEVQQEICHLVNMPANFKNPAFMADWIRKRFNSKEIHIEVLDHLALLKQNFGALYAVGKGSKTPPCLVIIKYHPKTRKKPQHIGLIGKGVTFDTGGISLKDPLNMHLMKSDMGGAAAVLGAIDIISQLNLNVHLTAVIPFAENAIGPDAYRPGDVLKSYSGKSIEVIDTDAEGRLILADAISYMVKQHKPDIMVDLATLTGSIIMTLGYKAAGLFTNNDDLAKTFKKSAETCGEKVWRLPLWDDYQEEMNSDIADIKNLATRPLAGAITAAKFLEAFTENHPAWVHLDIAGVAMMDSDYGKQRSATAYGVLLLKQWIEDLIK